MPCGGRVRHLASLPAPCPNSHRRPDDGIGGPKPAAETEDESAGTWRLTRPPNPRRHLRRRRGIESHHRSQRKGRADADAVASSAKSAARTVTGKKENMREHVHVKEEENKLVDLAPSAASAGRPRVLVRVRRRQEYRRRYRARWRRTPAQERIEFRGRGRSTVLLVYIFAIMFACSLTFGDSELSIDSSPRSSFGRDIAYAYVSLIWNLILPAIGRIANARSN